MSRVINWDDLPLILTPKDMREILPIGEHGIYQLFHRPDFPGRRFGKKLLVSRESLRKWLEQ
jgi:hypothetical protein